jgi:septal ring factor EnvC (AmiA/AmiB activator)
MTIAFISSALMLIDSNNKYKDLTNRFNTQHAEITQLQSRLNQTQTSLQNLNDTLTALEKNPLVKASIMIIDVVGLDYFNKYFQDPPYTPT